MRVTIVPKHDITIISQLLQWVHSGIIKEGYVAMSAEQKRVISCQCLCVFSKDTVWRYRNKALSAVSLHLGALSLSGTSIQTDCTFTITERWNPSGIVFIINIRSTPTCSCWRGRTCFLCMLSIQYSSEDKSKVSIYLAEAHSLFVKKHFIALAF